MRSEVTAAGPGYKTVLCRRSDGLWAAIKANLMVNPRTETLFRDIDALFRLGVVSGMSDGELLERFVAGSGCDTVGEMAFDAIVRRHGPMVLGVCLRVLGDYHAAEDAFQATFMVLAVQATSGPQAGVARPLAARGRRANCPPGLDLESAAQGRAHALGGSVRAGACTTRHWPT